MSDTPLFDGTYEKLVADFLRWQRRAKIAATITVIAGLLSIALGGIALLRGESTRTIVQSPEGVPCANPASARCLTESVGVSRAIGFVEACRIVEAARIEAPSCAVSRTGAGPANPPDRDRPRPESDQRGGSEPAPTASEPPDPSSGGSETGSPAGPPDTPGEAPAGDQGAPSSPGSSGQAGGSTPGTEPEHGGLAGEVDEAVDQVTDASCETAADLGVNAPAVCG